MSIDLQSIATRNAEYKALKAAASRAPWVADPNGEEIFPADGDGLPIISEEIGVIVSSPADQAFIVAACNMSPEADVDALLARVQKLEASLLTARDRFYIEAAGNQCWRCFQEIPHEWRSDERFHVTTHPLAGTKYYPCEAGGIWLALRLQQAAVAHHS